MSSQENPGCAESSALGVKPQETYQGQGGQVGPEGQMGAPQAQAMPAPEAGAEQVCSCSEGGQEGSEGGHQHGQQVPFWGEPQGCHDPYAGLMAGPAPRAMPHPGMMGSPMPQAMPHPGMMGSPMPQAMPHPGMMGSPMPGAHPSGCSCHDNPSAGMPQAGPMTGQVPPGSQFGQMFGVVNDIMNGKADPSTLAGLLDTSDPRFWKGMLMGAALTFLLTNASVKDSVSGLVGGLFGAGKDKDEDE